MHTCKVMETERAAKKLIKIPINFVGGACAFGGLGHRGDSVGGGGLF